MTNLVPEQLDKNRQSKKLRRIVFKELFNILCMIVSKLLLKWLNYIYGNLLRNLNNSRKFLI